MLSTPVGGRPQGNSPVDSLRRELWLWAKSGTRQWRRIELAERLPLIPIEARYRYWLVDRPHYAYGVHRAALGAKQLGFDEVTVVEFGVAGGNGLLALQRHAGYLGRRHGVKVHVVGFDSGEGMPKPVDHRDPPFRWGPGYYQMDVPALLQRLGDADLVLGDVAETVPEWIGRRREKLRLAPVGFVAFDLDYHSSTMASFELFRAEDASHLFPRIVCWMDDIVYSIPAIGELRAVADFNAEAPDIRAIGRIFGLRAGIPLDPPWADQIFEAHRFDHPQYGDLVEETPEQLPLQPAPRS